MIFLIFILLFSLSSVKCFRRNLNPSVIPKKTSFKFVSEEYIPSLEIVHTDFSNYSPPEVGNEIYIGSFVAVLPIIWGAYEFNNRIQTQRKCLACSGSGLVYYTKQGSKLTRPRKCWSCGGFIPWLGWKMFFFSTFFDVGNGGPLQRPSKDYNEINDKIKSGELTFKDNFDYTEDNDNNNIT